MTLNIVVLAAGIGSRLGRPHPKALTRLSSGETIIDRAIRQLRRRFQPYPIHVVVGYKSEAIMARVPDVGYIYNPAYRTTNTSKSLLNALRVSGPGGVLWLNGDVVFGDRVVDELSARVEAGRSFVCVNTSSVGDEEVKYTLDAAGKIELLSKQIRDGALGEAVGINYVAADERPILQRWLDYVDDHDYFESAIELAIHKEGLRFDPVDVTQDFAIEVDFPEDLERVNSLI